MKGKNMKKGGQAPSAKKLRTIPVVCLLISCLFGVVFVTSEQVSATDPNDPSDFNYDNVVPKHARKYVVNQAVTLILPPVKWMIVGGVVGLVLGGLPAAAVLLAVGGAYGTAISMKRNMLTFTTGILDDSLLRSTINPDLLKRDINPDLLKRDINPDLLKRDINQDLLKMDFNWELLKRGINPDLLKRDINQDLLKMDINQDLLKMDINQDLLKMDINQDLFNQELLKIRSNIPIAINPYAGSISSFDTNSIPKLRTDHIPKVNIPDTIPSFNPR